MKTKLTNFSSKTLSIRMYTMRICKIISPKGKDFFHNKPILQDIHLCQQFNNSFFSLTQNTSILHLFFSNIFSFSYILPLHKIIYFQFNHSIWFPPSINLFTLDLNSVTFLPPLKSHNNLTYLTILLFWLNIYHPQISNSALKRVIKFNQSYVTLRVISIAPPPKRITYLNPYLYWLRDICHIYY